jgi:hypothetical protein
MSADSPEWIAKAAKIIGLASTVGGILWAGRRLVEIGVRFLAFLLSGYGWASALVTAGILCLGSAILLIPRLRSQGSPLYSHSRRTTIAAGVVSTLGILVGGRPTLEFLMLKYRLFSETSFQSAAIALVREKRLKEASQVCARYLGLYPQRRSDERAYSGAIRAPIPEGSGH